MSEASKCAPSSQAKKERFTLLSLWKGWVGVGFRGLGFRGFRLFGDSWGRLWGSRGFFSKGALLLLWLKVYFLIKGYWVLWAFWGSRGFFSKAKRERLPSDLRRREPSFRPRTRHSARGWGKSTLKSKIDPQVIIFVRTPLEFKGYSFMKGGCNYNVLWAWGFKLEGGQTLVPFWAHLGV